MTIKTIYYFVLLLSAVSATDILFIDAVAGGDMIGVRECLAQNVDVNTRSRGYGRMTVLMLAIEGNHVDVVRLLLSRSADPNKTDAFGMTPLMVAVEKGHMEIVRVLIDGNADVDPKDYLGRTALILAAENGRAEFIEALLNAGADPNTKNMDGNTALIYAVDVKLKLPTVRLLVEAGAYVDEKNKDGLTAIQVANDPEIELFLKEALNSLIKSHRSHDMCVVEEEKIIRRMTKRAQLNKPSQQVPETDFVVGTHVMHRSKRHGSCKGVITHVNDDGTFRVKMDDSPRAVSDATRNRLSLISLRA